MTLAAFLTPRRSLRLRALAVQLGASFILCAAGCAQAQDVKEVTPQGQAAIVADLLTPSLGAAHPNLTIVEYFDYNCPYCRREQPTLQALLKQDPKVRLVYKEWPVLGPMSLKAAAAALAANWQGKYVVAHDALIGTPMRLASEDQIRSALAAAHVDLARLDRDEKAHLKDIKIILSRDDDEAKKLGLQGTPGLMVGRLLVFGGLDPADLAKLVAAARAHPRGGA